MTTKEYYEVHYSMKFEGKFSKWMNMLGEKFDSVEDARAFIEEHKRKFSRVQKCGSITIDTGADAETQYRIAHKIVQTEIVEG